jgi:hypothetical protein
MQHLHVTVLLGGGTPDSSNSNFRGCLTPINRVERLEFGCSHEFISNKTPKHSWVFIFRCSVPLFQSFLFQTLLYLTMAVLSTLLCRSLLLAVSTLILGAQSAAIDR